MPRHLRIVHWQMLGRAEVTDFQFVILRSILQIANIIDYFIVFIVFDFVYQNVVRFDVSVRNALFVDQSEAFKELVHESFYLGYALGVHRAWVLDSRQLVIPTQRVRHEVGDQIEILRLRFSLTACSVKRCFFI